MNSIFGTLMFALALVVAFIFGRVASHFGFAWYWITAGIVSLVAAVTFILAKL